MPNKDYNGDGVVDAQEELQWQITQIGAQPVVAQPPPAGVTIPEGSIFYGPVPEATQQSSSTGGLYNAVDTSPRSALALEERLRSSMRKQREPNVEFDFNLQKNPVNKRSV